MSISLRPVRLALYFDQELHAGGGYQQALNAALLAKDLPSDLTEVIYFTNHKQNIEFLHDHGMRAEYISISLITRVLLRVRRRVTHNRALAIWKKVFGYNTFEKYFVKRGVDLVYFLSPSGMACDLEELNYITTVWDLCHRDEMEFPEVRAGRVFEVRESKFHAILPKAVGIISDSDLGKTNIINRYGIDEARIHVLPFMPAAMTNISENEYLSGYVDIASKYNLTDPYVFYPAQFWAHKNHVYLLQGLKCLEEQYGITVSAIFSGGDVGNIDRVKSQAAELGVSSRIIFAGFVASEEIVYFYKQALALVMPTYFGPTNLPPLEAFALEVPVLYPNLEGLREQVGDAALLMDLQSPASMASQLARLSEDPDLRQQLIEKGRSLREDCENVDRLKILSNILERFQRKMAAWN